jgi:bll1643 protein
MSSSSERQRVAFKKQGEQLDELGKKYDAHIEKMKAVGKTDEEVTNTQLVLMRDLANKRAQHFELAQRLYKKNSDEYKAAQEAKKKASEDYQTVLQKEANNLRSIGSSYDNAQLLKKMGAVKYATEAANDAFVEQIKTLQILKQEGIVTATEYNRLLVQLNGDREQKIEDARKAAAEKRKQQLNTELSAIRAATDAQVALLKDGIDKERKQEDINYKRRIQDLQTRLNTEKGLTTKARAAIQKQIEIAEKQHQANLVKLDTKSFEDRVKKRQEEISLQLAAVKRGSDAEYSLKVEALQKQMELELANKELTERQKLLIQQKYNAQLTALTDEYNNNVIRKQEEAVRLSFENRINEAALQHQNTLLLEVEWRRAELDALQQMEGESDAAFKARQLAAQQEYVDAKKRLADYELEVETAKAQAIAVISGSISDLLEEAGENNKALAIASKVLALAEISISTGVAIAKGIAQAQSVPFPANIAAIATTIGTIMAGITSAIKTVKSAKFAQGGYVEGPGTGTSDSIPARLSDGESVNNALATSMFTPIYSALNQLGGGVPIVASQTSNQIAGEDMLARAVAKGVSTLNLRVGVDEIRDVESRLRAVESLGDV